MILAFFHFITDFKKILYQLHKAILVLDKFFLKYEWGGKLSASVKTTLKKPSLIKVKSKKILSK